MGAGEQTMKTWGYVSASLCIALALFSAVTCVMTIVMIKTSVSVSVRNNTEILAIITMVVAIGALLLGGVTIWKIFQADQIYLDVTSRAAQGKIAIAPGVPSVAPTIRSPQPPQIQQAPESSDQELFE